MFLALKAGLWLHEVDSLSQLVKSSSSPIGLSFFLLLAGIIGVQGQNRPGLTLQIVGGFPRLSLSGDVGSPCTIQYATNLTSGTNWFALTNVTLTSASALVLDQTVAATNQRFYRVVINVPANMVWIPAGSFTMGSPATESQRGPNSEIQ